MRASSPGYSLLPGNDLPISFPDPDGSQPIVLPEPSPLLSSGAVYFPSPIPPDEEPPYIPELHEERKALKSDSGHVGHTGGNAAANVGGNTGLAVSSEQSKPEGEIEEKGDCESKEKEPEKQEAKE